MNGRRKYKRMRRIIVNYQKLSRNDVTSNNPFNPSDHLPCSVEFEL